VPAVAGIVAPAAWLFVKQRQSVRMVRGQSDAPELVVQGPGHKRKAYRFENHQELTTFQSEIERRLARDGWHLEGFECDRRSGFDRRAARAGRERRRRDE
jgi:hypothetical protein